MSLQSPEGATNKYIPTPGFDLPLSFVDEYVDGLEKEINLLAEESKLTPVQAEALAIGLGYLRDDSRDKTELIEGCRSRLQWYDVAVNQEGHDEHRRHFDASLVDDATAFFERSGIDYADSGQLAFLTPASHFLLQTLFQKGGQL